MKKFKLFVCVIAIINISLLFVACEEGGDLKIDNKSNTEKQNEPIPLANYSAKNLKSMNIKIKNGILCFKDYRQFIHAINLIQQMSDEELDAWEQKIGFNSYRSKLNKIYRNLDNAKSKSEAKRFLDKDILKIEKNRFNEKELIEIIDVPHLKAICNPDGLYRIGPSINKVMDNYCITAKKFKDLSKWKNYTEKDVDRLTNKKGYKVYRYVPSDDDNPGGGGSDDPKDQTIDEPDYKGGEARIKNSSKTRACYIKFYRSYNVTFDAYQGYYRTTLSAGVKAYGKKKGWFGWRRYKTSLTLKDISCNATFFGAESFSLDYRHKNNTRVIYFDHTEEYIDDEPVQTVPFFNSFSGKATSRGVGANWVSLSYN